MLNLLWLDDFRTLVVTGNFSRAAEERHVTQPAFGRRIRALEEWIGADLFDRSTQPTRLTELGERFCCVADELTARVARVPDEARRMTDVSAVTLKIAATHALSLTFLPKWLRSLESDMAIGPIQLMSDVLERCETLMIQSKAQFVLSHAHPQAYGAMHNSNYLSAQIGKDTLIPVTAPDSKGRPLYQLQSASKLKAPSPILQYTTESGLGRIARAVVGKQLESLSVQVAFTAHLASVLRTMALDGRGIAWLPETLVEEDVASGKLVEAAASNWCIPLELRLYRERNVLTQAAEAFWKTATLSKPAPLKHKKPQSAAF